MPTHNHHRSGSRKGDRCWRHDESSDVDLAFPMLPCKRYIDLVVLFSFYLSHARLWNSRLSVIVSLLSNIISFALLELGWGFGCIGYWLNACLEWDGYNYVYVFHASASLFLDSLLVSLVPRRSHNDRCSRAHSPFNVRILSVTMHTRHRNKNHTLQ